MLKGVRQTTNFRSTLRVYAIPILAVIFGAASFLGIQLNLFQNLITETQLAVLFISFFTFYFFVAHVTTRAKWEKFYNYANLFAYINDGFKEIHHLHRKNDEDTKKEEIIDAFQKLCTYLADGFTIVTNSKCSVCIKYLVDRDDLQPDSLEFKTLCRDLRAGRDRLLIDKLTNQDKKITHSLSENTAFSEALGNEQIFISNKLPMLGDYKNTSARNNLYGSIATDTFVRIWSWPLPYRSTVVVPIVPAHNEYSEEKDEKDSLVGFLCIDSRNWGVFNKEFDGEILKGVSDGIFNTLVKFKEVIDK